ncbi:MAG TPA: anti-sigma factor [Terriglobales bacterium]|nr:anti-sigma factor [Terriglobales bacterium]
MTNHAQHNLLHAYLDDELDLVRSMDLEDHLVECGDCAHEVASYRALRERVGTDNLRYQAPASLRLRLLKRIKEQENSDKPQAFVRSRLPWWSWVAVAACLLLASATFVLDFQHHRERNLMNEIVSDHVRSLMATHLTDVLNSDQHTVKPWFTGKLDFSPEVRDLSSDGVELLGGRLEYIDGHSAAAIVYQRRKHVINVFMWPSAGSDQEQKMMAGQGFNLIEWKQAGMYYCVVSDLNQQELLEMSSLLRRQLATT